ncbi:MAG: helix-turn-helix domain-containing protein [Rhodothermaceae bacterium]|nr:helix-turn-helix domain-containing protein [Rhodothermaceae bacterium]
MIAEIPKISFHSTKEGLSYIEVLTLEEMYKRLISLEENDDSPFTPHRVNFFLIFVIVDGQGHHYIDFEKHTYKKESLLFVAKNQVQVFSRHDRGKGYIILFTESFLSTNVIISKHFSDYQLFNCYIGAPVIHSEESVDNNLVNLAAQMYEEFHKPNDFVQSELLRTLLHQLLLRAERIKHKMASKHVRKEWLNLFIQFKSLLENVYPISRNARDYAHKMGISYKHLNEICKAITDKTAKQFVDHVIITEIKRHLASTPLSVKEICYKIGFDEPTNLVQFFKRHVGQTPLQFRNALK